MSIFVCFPPLQSEITKKAGVLTGKNNNGPKLAVHKENDSIWLQQLSFRLLKGVKRERRE